MLRIVTDSLKTGAGCETGLPQGAVPRPSQMLGVCKRLDTADALTGAKEEERQDSWILSKDRKGRGFQAWQCHCQFQGLETSPVRGWIDWEPGDLKGGYGYRGQAGMVGQRGLAQKEGCGSAELGKRGRKELVQSQAWVPGTEGKQVLEQLTCVGHGEPSGLGAV